MSAEELSVDLTKLPPSLLDKIPVAAPPSGVQSNLVDPLSIGSTSKVVIWVTLPLMGVILLLRLYVRGRIQRSWGGDDVLAIVSALCAVGYGGILIYLADGPGGEHVWDIPVSRITAGTMKANLAGQCLYALCSIFTKTALLFLYLRIFSPARRAAVLIWAGVALTVVSHVAGAIAQIVILVPRGGRSWFSTTSSNIQDAATKSIAAQGVISVVTDFYVLCIPISLALQLHLPLARKFGVCAIFMTGLIACICSLVGTVIRFRLRHTEDMFWDAIPAYTLSVVEINAGIMCSCMPVLPVLVKRVAKSESYRKSVTYIRYLRRDSDASDGEKSKESGQKAHKSSPRIRIAIPRPTMTGLGTLFRWESRAQTRTKESMLDSQGSFDEDYHVQLKATGV
ncbi:hypothetical protein M011DRAFT_481299 [Sporormia fimetaria CBS 119925]|uniref:Rhodopsin domain-containing protein n=1 Tax=Sporormia fimetaria CBS 119925 TaxID=1340428 RepID=A0A6A6UYL0_9PLEO|nr:hypothetical protein M011DRAFT_481299 [Sporormia fimetaria CBS 119925]